MCSRADAPGWGSAPGGTKRRRTASGCCSRPPPNGSSDWKRACRSACRCGGAEDGPYEGKHYRLGRTLNVPQPLRRPHPPILIGGGGEKKTLRLVAQYAQACNLFDGPELERKLDVLRGHCEAVGRPYDEIEKTVMMPLDPGEKGEKVDTIIGRLEQLAALGVSETHGFVPGVWEITPLELIGREIVPAAAKF